MVYWANLDGQFDNFDSIEMRFFRSFKLDCTQKGNSNPSFFQIIFIGFGYDIEILSSFFITQIFFLFQLRIWTLKWWSIGVDLLKLLIGGDQISLSANSIRCLYTSLSVLSTFLTLCYYFVDLFYRLWLSAEKNQKFFVSSVLENLFSF